MGKLILKILADAFLIITIFIFQVSFLTTWPSFLNNLNIILMVLIFITAIISYQKALIWSIFIGVAIDIFSLSGFGNTSLSLLATVIAVNFLYKNIFTNRSFYSLVAMGLIGILVYNLVNIFIKYIYFWAQINKFEIVLNIQYIYNFLWQIALGIIFLIFLYASYNYINQRTKNIL